MELPTFQSGDVAKFKGKNGKWIVRDQYSTTEFPDESWVDMRRGSAQTKLISISWFRVIGESVHRQTPDGMVQVWPEVIQ